MQNNEGFVDRCRVGGTVWNKISDVLWDAYTRGRVVPSPFDTMWCVAPTRTAVQVQSSSIETLLCLCANYGHRERVRGFLTHARLAQEDIHPAARADAWIYLKDKDALAQVLLESPLARSYVCSLEAAHIDLDLVTWAQDLCGVIDAREAARASITEISQTLGHSPGRSPGRSPGQTPDSTSPRD